MTKPLHVLSLGAGVQSSTLALLAAQGKVTPMPDFAVFADTLAEPEGVYRWLAEIRPQLPFPVHIVSHGNLEKDSIEVVRSKKGHTYLKAGIPAFTTNDTGDGGMLWRKCTADYKVMVIRRFIKKRRESKDQPVIQWMGISLDEVHRMRKSEVPWMTNRYPLVEDLRWTRHSCLTWWKENGMPAPPRSACVFCPYHSDREWLRLKDEEPEDFARAVRYERDLQAAALRSDAFKETPFLHRSLVTLDKVDLDPNRDQIDMFGNECEGMCGV